MVEEGFQSWMGVEVHFAFALGVAWILEFKFFVKKLHIGHDKFILIIIECHLTYEGFFLGIFQDFLKKVSFSLIVYLVSNYYTHRASLKNRRFHTIII